MDGDRRGGDREYRRHIGPTPTVSQTMLTSALPVGL